MKKLLKIYTILFFGTLLFSACSKELNTTPDTALTELKTFSDVKAALLGAYDGFQSGSYYNNPSNSGTPSGWSALPDLMGNDFVETLESLGNWNVMSEMIYAADNSTVEGIFVQPYEIISRANNLLQSIGKYESGDTETEAKIVKAQALAIRAHAHFDCMRYFASEYNRTSTAAGIPYVTTFLPSAPFDLPARKTVKENYDLIFADLDAALVNFRNGGNTKNNNSRNLIDSTVVHAIKARVSYYASQWNDVITETTLALGTRPLGGQAAYIDAFATATESAPSSEVYWAIPSEGTMAPGRATNGSNASYRVTAALTAVIQSQGGAYIVSGITRFNQVSSGGVARTLNWKYPGVRSFKVFRAGEMILMRAEAKQRTGDITALVDLNQLRTNRGVATGTETGTALLSAILLQRRVELLGEGHRWFDLKRSTKSIVRLECGTGGNSRASNCTIDPSSRSWTFPIPFNDIKVNPNLSQNQGY